MPSLPPWSRRAFLATAGAGALTLTSVPYANAAPSAPSAAGAATAAGTGSGDEFATLRGRWLDLALGTGYDATAEPYASQLKATGQLAAQFRASMAPADKSLWADYPFDPPAGITQSYSRLWTMAEAYLQDGTGLTGDAGLLADVITGIDHLSAKIYNPTTAVYGNWWEWQIGSPGC